MRGQEEEADRLRAEFLKQFAERQRALRFADFVGDLGLDIGGPRCPAAHFADFVRGLQQAVVQPVFGHRLAVGAFALRDFVFMVRKDQVQPSAVDVKSLAQQAAGHGRALDVPARPARPPGAGP